jgi:hypothetical protein
MVMHHLFIYLPTATCHFSMVHPPTFKFQIKRRTMMICWTDHSRSLSMHFVMLHGKHPPNLRVRKIMVFSDEFRMFFPFAREVLNNRRNGALWDTGNGK